MGLLNNLKSIANICLQIDRVGMSTPRPITKSGLANHFFGWLNKVSGSEIEFELRSFEIMLP